MNGSKQKREEAPSSKDEAVASSVKDASPPAKKRKKRSNKKSQVQQSDPPRIGISKFYEEYPQGAIQHYIDGNSYRTTDEELRDKERQGLADPNSPFNYAAIRKAAAVHRQVRAYAREHIKPGMRMTEIADMIEDAVRALVEENPEDKMSAGIGFPLGLSLNDVAAHYTPNPGDKLVLKEEDILKVDIGVQVNGRICDSAFTLAFKPDHYSELLAGVNEAATVGIKTAGIDVRMSDIGAAIEEVLASYEVTVPGVNGGQPMQVKPIRDISGHNILPYQIHGGKSVPSYKNSDNTKMEEGEYFAIEPFGSTGKGRTWELGNCSHYAKAPNVGKVPSKLGMAKQLLNTIDKEFGTLPFCRRYLERVGEKTHLLALRNLVDNNIVQEYPPLADVPGSMTAQFEHTVILRPTCKEVVSAYASNPDY